MTVADLARRIVAAVAPDELLHFDVVCDAYFASPRALKRAAHARDEATAFNLDAALPVISGIVLAVVTDISKEALLAGGKRALARLRKAKVTADTPLPALPSSPPVTITVYIAEKASAYGASEQAARQIAEAATAHWTPPV
ncbi:hypothetical protein ACGFIJ_20065 [Microbispora bryophytorum]|uniref:hypothetical protein n=1 Tax=Microbispora bryophytorum TaxID=1460882 RepID=UPI0037124A30